MKKTLLFLTITTLSAALSAGHKWEISSDDMSDTIEKLRTATITEPAPLMKKWHDLAAKKLILGSQESLDLAQQIKDPAVRARYQKIAQTKQELAQQLKTLPLPTQPITKSLKRLPEWKKLAAEKMMLESEQLMVVAKQTDTPVLVKVAKKKAKKAHKIMRALEYLNTASQKSAMNMDTDKNIKQEYGMNKISRQRVRPDDFENVKFMKAEFYQDQDEDEDEDRD
ncbi:hypothetical protein H0X48_01950 [Candidatus Dependentiae bacterium]|nr:hypothetical protein [Candidatus Dependentiae bacterium]